MVTWGATLWWHTHKALPDGLRVRSGYVTLPAQRVQFLTDVTWADARGARVSRQEIFAATLQLIAQARDFLVLDYFLFNAQSPADAGEQQALAAQLRAALVARKQALPDLPVLLLVDPINSVYADELPREFAALRAAGIDVVSVNLDPLRDSNAAYSALWRLLVRWWASASPRDGVLPNVLDARGDPMRLGAFARLLNFKADHRKLVVTGDGRGSLAGIVSSANPHDASSAHTNVALRVEGPALLPLLDSTLAVARLSGWTGRLPVLAPAAPPADGPSATAAASVRIAVATEGAIRDALLERVDVAGRGAAIDVAMFYLTDRRVIHALVAASRRGAAVRVLLDPNKDAFGRSKSGLPNRQVASELAAASDGAIRLRWYRTHGEQFHAKLVAIHGPDTAWFTLGSANLTRRNLDDYNLEANVMVETPAGSALAAQVAGWFETLWTNRGAAGVEYTADLDVYADPSQVRYWGYRFMEATGLGTF